MSSDHRKPLRIGIVAPKGSQTLDIIGPVDCFTEANRLSGATPFYTVTLIGTQPGPIVAASGVRLLPDAVVGDASLAFDTLLVAGSPDFAESIKDQAFIAWLRAVAPNIRRVGSICNGAFVLAAAGLLEGRRATTHWQSARPFAALFQDVRIEPDCLFIHDGPIYTSAGVTAGIDLCLHLIEQDYGHATSLAVARALVVFLRRPGGQSQFSTFLQAQVVENRQIADVMDWAIEHLDADLAIHELARRACMSARNFTRVFHDEIGTSPARFVESARVEAARVLLETTELSLQQIAHRCGFITASVMRQAFLRVVTVAPADYRQRFRIVTLKPSLRVAQPS